ncbi:MAG: hypothetical protein R2752_16565 [Vicinamibacterales bacterium]
MTRTARVVAGVAIAAAAGIATFAVMASRAITIEQAAPEAAMRRFEAVRAASDGAPPLLVRDAGGRLVRNPQAPPPRAGAIRHLFVLAWRAGARRLVHADVPFWFFRLKAPAAQFLVRDTGFDLRTLGVTADDLARQGPGLVLDEADGAGNRVAIWTE